MNVADNQRWYAALRRLTAGYDWKMPQDQADAWFDQLERYPIDAVEQAMRDAPAESGRFKPAVGLVEQLAKKAMAGTPRSTGDWHAPEVLRDEHGKVTVAYRCGLCCDTGWRGVVTETGALLTEPELQAWELTQKPTGARADGMPHVMRRRCLCRTQDQQQRGAA
jgi:hypothetical protein